MTKNLYRTINETARPAAIEEPLNAAAIHPAARALLPLAVRLGIAPNTISIAGIAFGVLAAFAYYRFVDWRFALLGFGLMLCWHVMDGLDGMTARATGRSSDFGRFLDGFCDYSVFIVVNVTLAIAVSPIVGAETAWVLALTAGAAHALQAAFYEARRETYLRRRRGESALLQRTAAGGWLERVYNSVQRRMTASEYSLNDRCAKDPEIRQAYGEALQPIMRRMNVLGSSSRSPLILISCLAGSPVYYWCWEIFVLTPLAVLYDYQRQRAEAVL